MAAFFRGLLLFLFGAIAGAAAILFLTPSFQVDVRRGNTAIKPIELGSQPTALPAAVEPAAPKPAAPAPISVATAPPAAVAPVSPAAPASAEPTLDFEAISRHLILWPTAVTVKAPTTVVVKVEGQKPLDLALETGAVLQLARVLPTGQLEVRAKGAKFEIKSSLTDFAAELGKRAAELVAKGTKLDSTQATAVDSAAATATAPAAAAPAVIKTKLPPTLAQRVDVLYGRKSPEPEVTPVVSAQNMAPAISPAAAPAVADPAPAAPSREAAKIEEKGKDLDRKMNQLFK